MRRKREKHPPIVPGRSVLFRADLLKSLPVAAHSRSPGVGAAVLGAFSRGESLVPNSEF